MPVTTDPRRFWRLTKICLMPSLWWENQPLVAVEAMINGIPVVGSDRGGIPETLGDGGCAFPCPSGSRRRARSCPRPRRSNRGSKPSSACGMIRPGFKSRAPGGANKPSAGIRTGCGRFLPSFSATVRLQPRPPLVGTSRAMPHSRPDRTAHHLPGGDDRPFVRGLRLGRWDRKGQLLSSPCLHQGCPHEFTVVKNCPSAAGGLNRGLERARHEWVVCLHQDVVLPAGWDRLSVQQLREAERRFGPIGVAGVYGCRRSHSGAAAKPERAAFAAARAGWVVDRGRMLRDGPELPARSRPSTSCCWSCGAMRACDSTRRWDFIFMGPISAFRRGKGAWPSWRWGPLSAQLAEHRAAGGFLRSAEVFARKWEHRLPIATPCAIIDHGGRVHVLGNATDGPGSIAYAS